jgi:tetratricopeptide (TPR) repeat protein
MPLATETRHRQIDRPSNRADMRRGIECRTNLVVRNRRSDPGEDIEDRRKMPLHPCGILRAQNTCLPHFRSRGPKQKDLRDNQPELLAQHWDRAAKSENAIHYLERAADRAIERSASPEADAHLRRALHLISQLTEGPSRDWVELPIVLKHGAVLRALQGPYGDDVGHAFERARELSRLTGDQKLQALDGLFVYHLVGARNAAAREIATEVLAMGEACGDRISLMFGHSSLGMVALHTGDPVRARTHLQRAMQLYDVDADGPLAFVYGMDHAQTISSFLALTFWVLGLPEQAIAQENWAISHGRQLKHVYSVAQTGMFRIVRGAFARDWDAVAAIATETLEVGTRHSFRMPAQMSRFYLAFCRAIQGSAGSDVLEEMHAVLRMRRGVNYYPFYLALMAEAQAKRGDLTSALETIADAQSTVGATGERLAEPELLRLRGILLQRLNGVQAEASLRAALSEARRQSAFGWALRAGVSLAEFLASTGRRSDAFEELRSVYAACDRSAVSAELRAAGELLRSLAA